MNPAVLETKSPRALSRAAEPRFLEKEKNGSRSQQVSPFIDSTALSLDLQGTKPFLSKDMKTLKKDMKTLKKDLKTLR